MPYILPREEVRRIRRLYLEGHSVEEVARLTGHANCTVRKYLHRAGIMRSYSEAKRIKSRAFRQRERIVWLYKKGHGIEQIAELLGIWPRSVRNVLIASGVKLRRRGELTRKKLEERWRRIREAGRLMVLEGCTLKETAARLGVSTPTARSYVQQYCRAVGVPYPSQRLRRAELHRRIVEAYQQSGDAVQVARLLGLCPSTVRRHLRKTFRHAA